MTKMYYIQASDDEAEFSCDLFVQANDSKQAVEIWKKYCADNNWPDIDYDAIWLVPPQTADVKPLRWFHEIQRQS